MFVTALFYLFSLLTVASAVAVVASRNPVHSVLFLIFAFFNAAGLFILLGAEMLAMLLVIVYVGAVAVLFLFVVMMLNIKMDQAKKGFQTYLPLGLLLAAVLFIEISVVIIGSAEKIDIAKNTKETEQVVEASEPGAQPAAEVAADSEALVEQVVKTTNAEQIGQVLYTDYILYFQTCGLILLVAMIGAIVLTLRHRGGVRRQNISVQNARRKEDSLSIVKVEVGKGVE
jgi:NADH-quinone oxidoreductase subunit J